MALTSDAELLCCVGCPKLLPCLWRRRRSRRMVMRARQKLADWWVPWPALERSENHISAGSNSEISIGACGLAMATLYKSKVVPDTLHWIGLRQASCKWLHTSSHKVMRRQASDLPTAMRRRRMRMVPPSLQLDVLGGVGGLGQGTRVNRHLRRLRSRS